MDARWQIIAYLIASVLFRLASERLDPFIKVNVSRHPTWTNFGSPFLRFVYHIGFPYLALLLGALPARYLGLVGLEQLDVAPELSTVSGMMDRMRIAIALLLRSWLPQLGPWASLTILMAGLLTATWTLYRYVRHSTGGDPPSSGIPSSAGDVTAFSTVVYAAVHWSFYRGGIWWLGNDLYLGLVGGAALVFVEWGLCAWLARRPLQRLTSERTLIEAGLLIATAAIFYYVPNLWLLIPVHWLLARLCRRLIAVSPDLAHAGN
ncbi:MAG: hypothetical protein ACP5R2_01675 [Anaerolineae bacterium]